MRIAILALLLAGCASPRVYVYSWGKIIKASPGDVRAACKDATVWDSGERIHAFDRDRLHGCWLEGPKEMWVRWDNGGVILHELCHVDGRDVSVCDGGYRW